MMSTYLPTVFGENLMDVFDDFDRNLFRGFGNVDHALYCRTPDRVFFVCRAFGKRRKDKRYEQRKDVYGCIFALTKWVLLDYAMR